MDGQGEEARGVLGGREGRITGDRVWSFAWLCNRGRGPNPDVNVRREEAARVDRPWLATAYEGGREI